VGRQVGWLFIPILFYIHIRYLDPYTPSLFLSHQTISRRKTKTDHLALLLLLVCPVANRNFSIHKQEGGWDSVALEVIEDATKEGRGADVGAVVLGEGEFRVLACFT
jgi:hypothetical protein